MVNASYVIDAFLLYKENGLITTLGKVPEHVITIPDLSILPLVSYLKGSRKLQSI